MPVQDTEEGLSGKRHNRERAEWGNERGYSTLTSDIFYRDVLLFKQEVIDSVEGVDEVLDNLRMETHPRRFICSSWSSRKSKCGPMERIRGAFSREDLLVKKLISKARSWDNWKFSMSLIFTRINAPLELEGASQMWKKSGILLSYRLFWLLFNYKTILSPAKSFDFVISFIHILSRPFLNSNEMVLLHCRKKEQEMKNTYECKTEQNLVVRI